MKRFTIPAIAGLVLALGGGAAWGADPGGIEAKVQTCVACHGADGRSPSPDFPHIGGQYESYLLHSLRAYKSGERPNPIMLGMVAALSDQDLKDLAAYYAKQEPVLYVPQVPRR